MEHDRAVTILTIDDEEAIRKSLQNYLEDYGYRVIEAEDGRAGLDRFTREKPDLVLVDLRMPEVDGLEVLTRVQAEAPHTPIIVVSGTGIISDAVEALHLGAWDYLLKPIEDLSILRHAVEKALERARLIKENRQHQTFLEEQVRTRTEDLHHAYRLLQKSEEKYRLLFETMLHGFALHEPVGHGAATAADYRFLEINPAFERMTGIRVAQAAETICECLPQSGPNWVEIYTRVVQSGKPVRTESYFNELRRHFDIIAYKLGPDRFVSIVTDVTETKLLERQLAQAQKMESIGTLAGGIAHDFNNILSAIMGYTQIACLHMDQGDDAQQALAKVLKASDRAKDLVNQILSFSRQGENRRHPMKLTPIIQESLKLLRASLPATIEIRHQLEAGLDTIEADPSQMHQILMNLCTNALHAMQAQGGILTVTTTSIDLSAAAAIGFAELSAGSYLKLCVQDTGQGMDGQTLSRVFEPYFTTKEKGDGTGLGLAVVHGIVKSHGGAITVQSEVGRGTEFNVYLPRLSEDLVEEEAIQPEVVQGNQECILFVDDEETLTEIGQTMLAHLGYTAVTANNSQEALALFAQEPLRFDLVITDMTMPKMTGEKLAANINQIRPDVPIVICTGYGDMVRASKTMPPCIKGFLNKPLSMNDLARMLRKILDERRFA